MKYPQIAQNKLEDQALIIDVSCVTGAENNKQFRLCYYLRIQDELRYFFESPYFVGIADASLRKKIDDSQKYARFVQTKWVREVSYADHYLITFFQRKSEESSQFWLVSNDKFREYDISMELRNRIIEFNLIDGELIIYNRELLRLTS